MHLKPNITANMSNTDASSLISSNYCARRTLVPGTATQIHSTVMTSLANSTTAAAATVATSTKSAVTTTVYKGLPQQQVSLPATATATTVYATSATTPAAACLNKSSSCPDSPIRRVSSSLRNSAVGFATRFFNKCRAATFTVDGATYTIGK